MRENQLRTGIPMISFTAVKNNKRLTEFVDEDEDGILQKQAD